MIKRFLRTLFSVFATAIMMAIIPACVSRPSEKSGPKFVAHRGYSHSYVDNTEGAFRAASRMGFYGIETDIRMTEDGYFVCNHDAIVLYSDGTKKNISENDLATLLSKPLENNKTSEDVYLCTFESYLRACKEGGKVAVIELKDYFNNDDILRILDIVDREYDRTHVSFIAFSYIQLLSMKEADPSLDLQYLSQKENDSVFPSCLSERISIDVSQNILTEELVTTFHNAGLTVNVWTVDEKDSLESATQMGVDYVTTNVFYEE